jgi:hypothetical protein
MGASQVCEWRGRSLPPIPPPPPPPPPTRKLGESAYKKTDSPLSVVLQPEAPLYKGFRMPGFKFD